MLLYFLRGSLPWQGLKIKRPSERYRQIGVIKLKTPVEELCKGYPEEFEQYLKYTKEIQFREQPDYSKCRKLFRKAAANNNIELDDVFEWEPLFILKKGSRSSSKRKHPPSSNISRENKKASSMK